MAEVITMPRLSDTMTEGVVAAWLKKVGDKISEGDILAEIETDKATMEFESFYEGTLLYIGLQEGEAAPVDSLLAIIGNEGEDISALIGGGAAPAAEKVAEVEAPKAEEKTTTAAPAIPAGVKVITMPRLSDTMTEGTVASWIKKVGDKIEEGDILAEIETDKATMEFEAFESGTLLYIGIQEGESAPIDSVLAILGPAGTDVTALVEGAKNGGVATTATETPVDAPKAAESVAAPVATETATGGRVFVSPLAKKIAEEKGINLAQVKGSGENGRIIKRDVENFVPTTAQAPTQTAAPVAQATATVAAIQPFIPAGEVSSEEVKNSQMRKTIARRLAESKFTAPHYYLTIEIDMDNAMASRKLINELPDTKVSFNDMVVKACAMALRKHPQVNTQWTDNATIYNHHINVGVAVAVEDGLVVPVLPFTDQMSLTHIGAKVKELAGKAKTKKLTPAEMDGSTFTVSNLGMFGIQSFTSIINQPNSAILSVGAIVEKPVVKNGQIVVGNTMTVTLACDHRTVDGATGAQFLQTLKSYIENPVTMLA
ncbi:pyruvate dehydrogenase complex dihydrolipoamide acetyltransferase [Myroides odoratus]|uniref:Dihydrolipoamide acetyltransferase component of pyruvate dehydrogenase complex n=1 Tax=Myroides odoratus TaxID=256 RepID=A0A9Q6ZDP3_MYROD|nr:pyruvate dehydrogenase complex dihydrolipoamide acetyltransferase [Myroides odoratus]EHQ42084.1 pyruvate dehydrogenase complex dihydrolipoamide acetyltransferase [Myroides odoratus DSM 2801]EKB09136.1 pyruvate dehydrogenase complex dihydrolipoamide acetyltransferase [Myroides odoratus CIP 103059]QQT99469.1 2-oxo acid dehydrogenase subunit E2 [Myroides odoratus]WQD58325.1 2-oxo acid dehydrogenase subunit E2 [Myroides odoratus]STZ29346.1 Dihydrolipoyllysine-residue acetyltransferase component